MSKQSLRSLLETLESVTPVGPGATASLLNENDEHGTVVIRDAAGRDRYLMPRSVYDDLKKWKPSI